MGATIHDLWQPRGGCELRRSSNWLWIFCQKAPQLRIEAICVQIHLGANKLNWIVLEHYQFLKDLVFSGNLSEVYIGPIGLAINMSHLWGASDELYRAYVSFEKQHGDRDAIEEVGWSHRCFEWGRHGQPYLQPKISCRWSSTRDASSMRNLSCDSSLMSDVEIVISCVWRFIIPLLWKQRKHLEMNRFKNEDSSNISFEPLNRHVMICAVWRKRLRKIQGTMMCGENLSLMRWWFTWYVMQGTAAGINQRRPWMHVIPSTRMYFSKVEIDFGFKCDSLEKWGI